MLALMMLGAFAVVLFLCVRRTVGMQAIEFLATDGIMALVVLLGAGGYGYLLFRRFGPKGAPPLLAVSTASVLGLWMLAMAVWAVGSLVPAALTAWVWWPVIAAGVGLALWHLHRPLAGKRLPEQFEGYNLIWILVFAAAAVWVAGAALPPGRLGTLTGPWPMLTKGILLLPESDAAGALVRTMQLPREFLEGGGVRALDHNVYSHFPLCAEMLRLLGMCLRGGAAEGAGLATMIVGLFAIPMVAGTFAALRETRFRGWAATVFVATAPWALYLATTGRAELAWMSCLTLALLWLRRWLEAPDPRTAVWIGGLIGVAMGFGYGAALTVAAPVAAVMLATALPRPKRLPGVGGAVLTAVVVLSPWLIRDAAVTGNPVFPMATEKLGRGHWDPWTADRWRRAHGLHPLALGEEAKPPQTMGPARLKRLVAFLSEPRLAAVLFGPEGLQLHAILASPALLVIFALTLLAMGVHPRGPTRWDWAVLAILVTQLALWLGLTGPRTPARMPSVCAVPFALLCAGGLARLSEVVELPLMGRAAAGGRWGLAPAALLLAAAGGMNLLTAGSYLAEDARWPSDIAMSREFGAASAIRGEGKLAALVGEDRALHFPPNVVYATAYDPYPLAPAFADSDDGEQLARRLRDAGVTHVLVAWLRIDYWTRAIGWPEGLAADRLQRLLADWPVADAFSYQPATQPASQPETLPATAPATQPAEPPTPVWTLYQVPAPR